MMTSEPVSKNFLEEGEPPKAASSPRVALVDDDPAFREALSGNLIDEGYDVVPISCGEAALTFFRQGGRAEAVLLDWRMPGMDGIEVLNTLRAEGYQIPVIFLTVLSDQIYEEAALAGGAIDFVEKSRNFPILLHRLQLAVAGRKAMGLGEGLDEPEGDGIIRVGDLEMNPEACRLAWRGQTVDLTLTEYRIVASMAQRVGDDISYRDIYDQVRGAGFVAGYGAVGYRTNVRAFIKRIRQKFKTVDQDFDAIENYPGFGYRWRA